MPHPIILGHWSPLRWSILLGLFVSMFALAVPTRGSHDAAAAGGTEIVFSAEADH